MGKVHFSKAGREIAAQQAADLGGEEHESGDANVGEAQTRPVQLINHGSKVLSMCVEGGGKRG